MACHPDDLHALLREKLGAGTAFILISVAPNGDGVLAVETTTNVEFDHIPQLFELWTKMLHDRGRYLEH